MDPASTGVLFLDDLHAFAPWSGERAPAWAEARGLRGPLLASSTHPPAGLVLVVRSVTWSRLALSAAWLRLARRLALVIDESDEPVLATDPELREVAELERAETAARLGNVRATIVVNGDLGEAIDRALDAVRGGGPWPAWTADRARAAAPVGPWIRWSPPRWSPDHDPRLEHSLRLLASQVCSPGGRPALLDAVSGERIDLASGERRAVPRLAGAGDAWRPVAATLDGDRWLRCASTDPRDRSPALLLDGASPSDALPATHGSPIGVDPSSRIAWAGRRCTFDWYVLTHDGPAAWTPSSHGWPDGHGRKLYGYENNHPLWVHLAPDASACLSVYEHDVLLTPGLPLWWRDIGRFALAERARGEPRALFFQRGEGEDVFPGDPACGDEDARDRFATVTLGPSDALRYVVGLDAPTWRLRGESGEKLGGAAPIWIVFDAAHREVRRSEGRLLAGWDRWVVIERDARLVREDLTSGDAEALGPAERAVTAAVAIAGTPNVVLLSMEGREAWLRVV